MLRRLLGVTAATGALVLGALPVLTAAPAHADDQFATLTVHPEWGFLSAGDGQLRRGCHTYSYSYSIDPPEGIWGLETEVRGPDGEALASGAILDGFNPLNGSDDFTICRNSTREGTFTVLAKLSVTDDQGREVTQEGQLPPATFTLLRAAKPQKPSKPRNVWRDATPPRNR